MAGVGALGVVIGQPFADLPLGFSSRFKSAQADAFIFQRPPQPLDHAIVNPAPASVHRDGAVTWCLEFGFGVITHPGIPI